MSAQPNPIPWAEPLSAALQAIYRAEKALMVGKREEAVIDLREAEKRLQFARTSVEGQ